MAEVLSQNQIDALLNSLQGTNELSQEIERNEDEIKYMKYDL
jgi:flagellar motor switch protein FliM